MQELGEKFPKYYIPNNKTVLKNYEQYYDTTLVSYPELENDGVRRIFNSYDKKGQGQIAKADLEFLFSDLKTYLTKSGININDKRLLDVQLDFYVKCQDKVDVKDIKVCFGSVLHHNLSNTVSSLYNVI